ncbi:MAG: FHA domain-containing protein [Mycobacterium sp.]
MTHGHATRLAPAGRMEITTPFAPGLFDGLADAVGEAPETAAGPADGLPVGSSVLVVKRGPNAGTRFALDQEVTRVGRHPNSDIFLEDITVSRRHIELHREDGGVRIVDVDSINGTCVNRRPIRSVLLVNGDEIQVGNFRLVFLVAPGAVTMPETL